MLMTSSLRVTMRILRGLTSRLLPCGCIAGIYETYDAQVVTLLDERHPACAEAAHTVGSRIPDVAPVQTPAPDSALRPNR